MTTATVTSTSLNLRSDRIIAADNIVALLERGTSLEVLTTEAEWLRVSANIDGQTRIGWVSRKFVRVGDGSTNGSGPTSPAALPIPDDGQHPVKTSGDKVIGPDGQSFARRFKLGYATLGVTSLRSWLASGGGAGSLSQSVVRSVRAVSLNEGRLEAVNSYDNAHMSFGVFQWTAGSGDDAGELAGLISLVAEKEPSAFDDCFKRYKLGSKLSGIGAVTGLLTLDGKELQTGADKAQLRSPAWAYRFWRAGHDEGVRRCELALAAARIARFRDMQVKGHAISDWISSEYGTALILDEHVNRPGHVPGTLETAILAMKGGKPLDPTGWTTAEEGKLIAHYLDAREATSMTDPAQRATRITDCVHDATLSDARGSFAA